MAIPTPIYVRGANPVWSMVDLAGLQTDDTFYLWVLNNEIPYTPATVYQTTTGTPWTSPIQFLGNGTLPSNLYFNADTTYRLEVRQNDGTAAPSQADALIYLIENYSPNGENATESTSGGPLVSNQITNPQFSDINFTSGLTLTAVANPDPIDIGPGWSLELRGTGSLTLERVALNSTTSNPTNSPYALRFNLSGSWTGAKLRQRFTQAGMLWADKFVTGSVTARIDGVSRNLSVSLEDSMGAPLRVVLIEPLSSTFEELTGVVALPASTNTNLPPSAYIDAVVLLPTVGDVYLTSVQIVPNSENTALSYAQQTVNRQIDHTFNYYKSKLEYKPIPSALIGWDFPKNPAQWGATYALGAIGANKSDYVWDQTIIYQNLDDAFTASRSSVGALKVEIEKNATQIALVQYIETDTARELLLDKMAVHIAAKTVVGLDVAGTVSIWYNVTDANLPDVAAGTNDSIVLSLDASGKPATQNGTWSEVPRVNPQDATFTLTSNATEEFNDIDLNGWDLSGIAGIGSATLHMAVVVGFAAQLDGDIMDFHSISLCSGDIATRPAAQSVSEAELSCQRYYWKSFAPDTVPVQGATGGTGYAEWQLLAAGGVEALSTIWHPTTLWAVPTLTLYNPAAANALIRNYTLGGDATSSGVSLTTVKNFRLTAQDTGGALGNILGVHFTVDARLGIA